MGRSALFLLAAIGLIVGSLVMGTLTTPEPEATPSTTSTTISSTSTTTTTPLEPPIDLENFSVDQIETGSQLEWELAETVDDAFPYTIVKHSGQVYLFSSSAGGGEQAPKGLRAWRSANGVSWESLGTVIDQDHQISSVSSTSMGLIAVEANGVDGDIHFWGSMDGASWAEVFGSIPTSADSIIGFQPSAVVATDEVVAVAGQNRPKGVTLAEQHLHESTGSEVDLSGLGVEWDGAGDNLHLVVWGPLGIEALRIPASDLDLSEDELETVNGLLGSNADRVAVWIGSHNGEWTSTHLEGANWLSVMTTSAGGRLVAFGHGVVTSIWQSEDGTEWERAPTEGGIPYFAETWRDGFVALGDIRGGSDALISGDGIKWEGAGLGDLFPTQLQWYPVNLAAGSGGIAVTSDVRIRDFSSMVVPEPSSIETGGYTLTLDHEAGQLTSTRAKWPRLGRFGATTRRTASSWTS